MKTLRLTLLGIALVLATAAVHADGPVPASTADSAVAAPAENCDTATSELDLLLPPDPTQSSIASFCGACSAYPCANRGYGIRCTTLNGNWGWCIDPLGGRYCSNNPSQGARCQCAQEYY